jgi:hypothetical protein
MKRQRVLSLLVVGIVSIAAARADATDGYFANGHGTNYKAISDSFGF